MPQTYSTISTPPALFANNLNIKCGASETIVLDKIPSLGFKTIGVTIVNHSGSITVVALYGSPDGINYASITGLSSFSVGAGNMGHQECTSGAIYQYLRLTATGTAVVDVYINILP
jgi:hypothetical protein